MTYNIWQGERVRLRDVEPDGWRHFFTWNEDTHFAQITGNITFPESQAGVKKWVTELSTAEVKNDEFRWVTEDRDGEFVGTINTHTCDPRNGTFQYGVAVRREHWRQGYAIEAIHLVLGYFFQELRYQKANVHIDDFNESSISLHQRLGFREEGRLRRMGHTEGRYYDWILMGLTREEFEAEDADEPGAAAIPCWNGERKPDARNRCY
jgi:RimJ/RimL family protein N-acetyltransferase